MQISIGPISKQSSQFHSIMVIGCDFLHHFPSEVNRQCLACSFLCALCISYVEAIVEVGDNIEGIWRILVNITINKENFFPKTIRKSIEQTSRCSKKPLVILTQRMLTARAIWMQIIWKHMENRNKIQLIIMSYKLGIPCSNPESHISQSQAPP